MMTTTISINNKIFRQNNNFKEHFFLLSFQFLLIKIFCKTWAQLEVRIGQQSAEHHIAECMESSR
jgi:hypothetical protein